MKIMRIGNCCNLPQVRTRKEGNHLKGDLEPSNLKTERSLCIKAHVSCIYRCLFLDQTIIYSHSLVHLRTIYKQFTDAV